jgi:hypothetical protein
MSDIMYIIYYTVVCKVYLKITKISIFTKGKGKSVISNKTHIN